MNQTDDSGKLFAAIEAGPRKAGAGDQPRGGRCSFRSYRLRLALVTMAGVGLAGAWYWGKTLGVPEPPLLDLTVFDSAIARAITEARTALVHAPRSEAAWGRYGMILLAHRFGPEAYPCFEQAARFDPREPRWPYYQGLILLNDNPDEKTAVGKFQRALELAPNPKLAPRLRLVQLFLEEGLWEELQACLDDADQTNPYLQLARARLALAQGDLAKGEAYLNEVRAHPATRKATSQLLSELFQRQGKSEQASLQLKLALALPPDRPWEDAYYEELKSMRVGLAAELDRAQMLADQNRLAQALGLLRQTVKTYPDSEAAWQALGSLAAKCGDFATGDCAFEAVLRLNPENYQAHLALALSLARQGKKPAAIEHLKQAARNHPMDPLAHFYLAEGLVDLGQRPAAMEALREAIKVCPPFVEARFRLSALLAQEGDTAGAMEQLRQALEVEPSNSTCLKMMQELQAAQNRKRGPGQ
jgi:tetratricopeptide (TPR) repeat protein